MRYLLGVLVPVCFGALLYGCSAGTNADLGSGGSASDGQGNGAGNGNATVAVSAGAFMTAGNGGSSGAGVACTDASCVGNTPQGGCDNGLALDGSGMDGAKAIGLCQQYQSGGWGVMTADWVKADGTQLTTPEGLLGKGILTHFGNVVTPREGKSLLALSSGTARNPTDPGYQAVGGTDPGDPIGGFDKGSTDNPPPGYPQDSPACPGVTSGQPHDSAGLRIKLHIPHDAQSISYNFDFYTYEFPGYICSEFNDFFVALMNPAPADALAGNISFDQMHNLISVNAGFLSVCQSQLASSGVVFPCQAGPGELAGTGFDQQTNYDQNFQLIEGSAATGWLETKAPVTPDSEITLEYAVWDSGDGILDSTVLVDNFKFELSATVTGTTPVPN